MSSVENFATQMLDALCAASESPPLTELRLHPEDFAELRRTSEVYQWGPEHDRFYGVPVIVDKDAPRLPRQKVPAPENPKAAA